MSIILEYWRVRYFLAQTIALRSILVQVARRGYRMHTEKQEDKFSR